LHGLAFFPTFAILKTMSNLSFLTVGQSATAEIVIERSRFIGHCLEADSEAAAKSFINQIRALHSQATHNCYAYRVGGGEHPLEYFNDHGEPAGTAGKPILGAIGRLNLTNTVVVVTRYFGGKKLGVRGLIEAYGQAATAVLAEAGQIRRIPQFTVRLTYGYANHSLILHRMNQIGATILESQFTEVVATNFTIPEESRARFDLLIQEIPLNSLHMD
jgi:uncharacterized YigZ family protein